MSGSKVKDEHYELSFDVERCIRYHIHRQQYFERWHKITMFCAVFFNPFSFASFTLEVSSDWPIWVKSSPCIIATILMVIDVLVGLSRRAWEHFDLIRQFTDLQRRLQFEKDNPTEQTLKEVRDALSVIWAKEPTPLRVLNALCYNEVSRLRGRDKDYYISVRAIQRFCANIRDIRADSLQLVSPSRTQ